MHPGGVSGGMCGSGCVGVPWGVVQKWGFWTPEMGYISDPEKVVLLGWGGKVGFWGYSRKGDLWPAMKVTVFDIWGSVCVSGH